SGNSKPAVWYSGGTCGRESGDGPGAPSPACAVLVGRRMGLRKNKTGRLSVEKRPGRAKIRLRLFHAAALGLATTPLARLAHLALALDARLLVEAAALDLLQDAL